MKISLILGGIALLASSLQAQTTIADEKKVSGVWKKSASPYIVEGEVIVPKGKTLTIEPGVVIRLQTGEIEDYGDTDFQLGMFRVYGTIIAKGTKNEPIVFTHQEGDGEDDRWGTIQVFSDKNESVFSYCTLEYARGVVNMPAPGSEDIDNATGAVSFVECDGLVEFCVIRKSWAAVNAKHGSKVTVNNCTVLSNNYGLEANTGGKMLVASCILYDNETGFFINEVGGIKMTASFVQDGQWDDNIKDGGKNIQDEDDPKFKNFDDGDFTLTKKSPCRKKGVGGKNMGAF